MSILLNILRPISVLSVHLLFGFTDNEILSAIDLILIYAIFLLIRGKENNVIVGIVFMYLINDLFFPGMVGISAIKFFGAYLAVVIIEKYFPSLSKDFAWPSLFLLTIIYLILKNNLNLDGFLIISILINTPIIIIMRYLLGTQRVRFTYR